jgi:RecA/RadA recombinase
MDNEYWISNADLTYNFSNKLSITNGLRHNNYETSYTTSYVGFFSNLRYEYKDNCNLYIGYKTAQDEIDENYVPNYRQAYFKVTYTL